MPVKVTTESGSIYTLRSAGVLRRESVSENGRLALRFYTGATLAGINQDRRVVWATEQGVIITTPFVTIFAGEENPTTPAAE